LRGISSTVLRAAASKDVEIEVSPGYRFDGEVEREECLRCMRKLLRLWRYIF
jgi:hypothetical protein